MGDTEHPDTSVAGSHAAIMQTLGTTSWVPQVAQQPHNQKSSIVTSKSQRQDTAASAWGGQRTLTPPLLAVMRRSYTRTQVSEPPTANRWGLDDGESIEFRSTAVRMRRPRERGMDESALLLVTSTSVQGCSGSRLSSCLTAQAMTRILKWCCSHIPPALQQASDVSCAGFKGNIAEDSPVLSSAAEMMRLGLPGSLMSFFTRC